MSDGRVRAPGFRIGASIKARFDASGKRLVTLGKRITLWSVEERRHVGVGPRLLHASQVDFSPDGRLVAAKNTAGDVLVLGTDSREEIVRFSGKAVGEGTAVRFSPDGACLIDANWDGRLMVRDPASGKVEWAGHEQDGQIFNLTCSRDRELWAYTRSSHGETRVIVRTWLLWQHPGHDLDRERDP